MMNRLRSSGKLKRGITFVEVMFAITITSFVMIILTNSTVQYLRAEKRLAVIGKLRNDANVLSQQLNLNVATAQSLAVANANGLQNNRLVMVFPDGSSRIIEFVVLDNDVRNIRTNYLVEWTGIPPNDGSYPTTVTGLRAAANILIENVSPVAQPGQSGIFNQELPGNLNYMPIFRRLPDRPVVEVRIRIGDNAPNPLADSHGVTGPGWKSYVLQTSLFPRNQ